MPLTGYVAFCDDIRFENTGKAIIIGLYSEDLIPSHLPQVTPMSFWVRLYGAPSGQTEVRLSISVNGREQHSSDVIIQVTDPSLPANLFYSAVLIHLAEEGEISLELSGFPDGEYFRDSLHVLSVQEDIVA